MAFWHREAEPDHARFLDFVSTRLDGALDPESGRELDAHLARCEPCRVRAEELALTRSLAMAMPGLRVRRSFALSPHQIQRARAGRLIQRLNRLSMAAAAALALSLSGTVYLSTSPPVPPAAETRFAEGPSAPAGAGDVDQPVQVPAASQIENVTRSAGNVGASRPRVNAATATAVSDVDVARGASAGFAVLLAGLLSGRWAAGRRAR